VPKFDISASDVALVLLPSNSVSAIWRGLEPPVVWYATRQRTARCLQDKAWPHSGACCSSRSRESQSRSAAVLKVLGSVRAAARVASHRADATGNHGLVRFCATRVATSSLSARIYHHVARLMTADVSEGRTVSIFRLEDQGKQETSMKPLKKAFRLALGPLKRYKWPFRLL
jgi:hypothetical protein